MRGRYDEMYICKVKLKCIIEIKRVEWDSKSLNCLALKSILLCITRPVLLGQWLFLVYVSVLLKKYTFLLG